VALGERSLLHTFVHEILWPHNTVYVCIGLLLIGVAAYGKKESILVSVPAIAGIIGCGVFLIFIAIFGLIGALRHNQIILFFYMIIMSLLFILLLAFSIAALAVTKTQQHALIKKAWTPASDKQKVHIETRFKCCGLDKEDGRKCGTASSNITTCYEKLEEPLNKAVLLLVAWVYFSHLHCYSLFSSLFGTGTKRIPRWMQMHSCNLNCKCYLTISYDNQL